MHPHTLAPTTSSSERMRRLEVDSPGIYRTSLYDITGEIAATLNALDELDRREGMTGEERASEAERLMTVLAEDQQDLPAKLENCGKYMRALGAEAGAIRAEEDRLAEKRAALESRRNRFREYMVRCLQQLDGRCRWTGGGARVQKGPPTVEILDEAQVPTRFLKKQPSKIMVVEIGKALKAGEALDFARLVDGKPSLRLE